MKATGVLQAGLVLAALCGPYVSAQTSQERAVLARFHELRASSNEKKEGRWVQPINRTEKCEIYMQAGADPSAEHRWLGDCLHGRASGLGIVLTKSDESKVITLEGYGTTAADIISYRQVEVAAQRKVIVKGRFAQGMSAVEVFYVGTSPKGNVAVASGHEYCRDGECVRLKVDPLSGSTTHEVEGPSYKVAWLEQRAENAPLFAQRGLMMDGTVPFEKHVIDGVVYDLYHNLYTGQVARVAFSDSINGVLALPIERYSSVKQEIDAAIADANSKFADVFERYCRGQKDPDVRIFCEPSSLLPRDDTLADARVESNEMGRASYAERQRIAATYNAPVAQTSMDQAHQMRGQVLAAEQQRQAQAVASERQRAAGQDALRRGLEAISQVGQAAQLAGQQLQQSYGSPQVQPLKLHQTGVVHCRTIGYITTCN